MLPEVTWKLHEESSPELTNKAPMVATRKTDDFEKCMANNQVIGCNLLPERTKAAWALEKTETASSSRKNVVARVAKGETFEPTS